MNPKALVENPHYQDQRMRSLENLNNDAIDMPIIGLINAFNELSYCFTVQSCFGHFVYNGQSDPKNIEPLPSSNTIDEVEYRIAYIALCIEYSNSGKMFLAALKDIKCIDPGNIQFCSAKWFWDRQVNSYALQVEPDRFKFEDMAVLDYMEALKIESIRNEFFAQLYKLIQKQKWTNGLSYQPRRQRTGKTMSFLAFSYSSFNVAFS